MTDFADARNRMVDSQIRPNKVTDPRILAAMRRLPREAFLPPALAPLAYADEDVKLGGGRVMVEPMVIARLVQLAAARPGEQALVVAAGTGYGAALLGATGAKVTALEEAPALLDLARVALAAHAPGVTLVAGPLAGGWPCPMPTGWDIILIEGAVREIPPAIAGLLAAAGGRLVTVLAGKGLASQAVIAERVGGGLRARPAFDCATPPIPALLPAPGFVF